MSQFTQILSQIEAGDPTAAEQLLPLVYAELRKLAAAKLVQEKPGQTLQATALVHEAYLRLVGGDADVHWNSRGHFFGAAAEAMRRILVDNARKKQRPKHGGQAHRISLEDAAPVTAKPVDDILLVDEALSKLAVSATPLGTQGQSVLVGTQGQSVLDWNPLEPTPIPMGLESKVIANVFGGAGTITEGPSRISCGPTNLPRKPAQHPSSSNERRNGAGDPPSAIQRTTSATGNRLRGPTGCPRRSPL